MVVCLVCWRSFWLERPAFRRFAIDNEIKNLKLKGSITRRGLSCCKEKLIEFTSAYDMREQGQTEESKHGGLK